MSIRFKQEQKWAIVDEYYYDARKQGKRTDDEHAREIIKAAPGPITRAYVDPSAVNLKNALASYQVPVQNAWNHELGYGMTNGLLQMGLLEINTERAPALTTEIEDLIYNLLMQKPDPKCSDHGTDDMRYIGVEISELMKATYGAQRYGKA